MGNKRQYAPEDLHCSDLIHPGEMLKEELQARGMTQREFASIIDMSYSVLNEVLNGKQPINEEMALKIEAATGIKARIWIGMQTDYNIDKARCDIKFKSVLEKIRQSAAML